MRIGFPSRRARLVAPLAVAALVFGVAASAEAGGQTATGIGAGGDHTCAVSSDTTVWCWGSDNNGQLGDGTTGGSDFVSLIPLQVQTGSGALTGVKAVSLGYSFSCALKTSGTVWCWGWDDFGELGDGTMGDTNHERLLPVQVKKGSGHLTGVTAISAGDDHACALVGDKTAWCWGYDGYGALGDGTTGDSGERRLSPVHVRNGADTGALADIKAISSGERHTCALKTDGTLRCWGEDRYGALGDGTTGDASHLRKLPVVVKKGSGHISTAMAIAAGGTHSCAVLTDKTAWCWGHAAEGELGDGTTGDSSLVRLKPVEVLGGSGALSNVTRIAAGSSNTCAVRSDATAWCWGHAREGAVGDGTTGDSSYHRLKAVEVIKGTGTLVNVSAVSVGASHACALVTSGVVWCWGSDLYGEIGDGTTGGTDAAVLKAVKAQLPF